VRTEASYSSGAKYPHFPSLPSHQLLPCSSLLGTNVFPPGVDGPRSETGAEPGKPRARLQLRLQHTCLNQTSNTPGWMDPEGAGPANPGWIDPGKLAEKGLDGALVKLGLEPLYKNTARRLSSSSVVIRVDGPGHFRETALGVDGPQSLTTGLSSSSVVIRVDGPGHFRETALGVDGPQGLTTGPRIWSLG